MTEERARTLRIAESEGVWVVRMDGGPHQLFGLAMAEELAELVERADADPEVHAVVFTGAHPERFISHADVRWLQEGGAETPTVGPRAASAIIRLAHAVKGRALTSVTSRTPVWGAVQLIRLHETFLTMNGSGVVFVAALNGSALGLGAEFAWACDLRVIADDAFIGQPEVLLGFNPGGGGTQRLTRLVGPSRAKDIIFTGRFVKADEALAIGLVDKVVPAESVYDEALAWAKQFSGAASYAIRAAKESIDRGSEVDLETGLEIERVQFAALFATEDRTTGMRSFMENGPGKAQFEGR